MITCLVLSDIGYPIVLKQSESGKKLFTVTYGLQITKDLSYSEACTELGQCILHALACESKLDNEGI